LKIDLPPRNYLLKLSSYNDWEEDALWAYYHKNPIIRSVYIQRLQTIIDIVPSKKFDHILDVGTGSGILIPTLFKICKSIYGLDINENLIYVREMLLKLNINPHLTVGDIRDLPYRDNHFDLIVCSSTLEHLNKKDLIKSITKIRKIMKNDGLPPKHLITVNPTICKSCGRFEKDCEGVEKKVLCYGNTFKTLEAEKIMRIVRNKHKL